jgi:hypothetical protein
LLLAGDHNDLAVLVNLDAGDIDAGSLDGADGTGNVMLLEGVRAAGLAGQGGSHLCSPAEVQAKGEGRPVTG